MLSQNVNLSGKTVFVTGAAGFIGSNLVIELMKTVDKIKIVGIDNMNDYYDVSIRNTDLPKLKSSQPKNHRANGYL